MFFCFFFFKQKTAYEMRISDWSSDVCSSDLREFTAPIFDLQPGWGMKEDGYPMLVNYGWDAARSTLSSYTRGRGLGDCGGAETYVWAGRQFRLVDARSMGECRCAMKWSTTWRVRSRSLEEAVRSSPALRCSPFIFL